LVIKYYSYIAEEFKTYKKMILNKKLSKAEKVIIALQTEKYTTMYCETHGVWQTLNKEVTNCPYCKKECEEVENIEELVSKYKKELKIG